MNLMLEMPVIARYLQSFASDVHSYCVCAIDNTYVYTNGVGGWGTVKVFLALTWGKLEENMMKVN